MTCALNKNLLSRPHVLQSRRLAGSIFIQLLLNKIIRFIGHAESRTSTKRTEAALRHANGRHTHIASIEQLKNNHHSEPPCGVKSSRTAALVVGASLSIQVIFYCMQMQCVATWNASRRAQNILQAHMCLWNNDIRTMRLARWNIFRQCPRWSVDK